MWQEIVVGCLLAIVLISSLAVVYYKQTPLPYISTFAPLPRPALLLATRALTVVFYLVVLIDDLSAGGIRNYDYYTFWNFNLQTIYFAYSLVVQWRSVQQGHARRLNTLFDVVLADALLVMTVFWAILYDSSKPFRWVEVAEHGVNSVLVLLEFALNDYSVQKRSVVYASCLFPAVFGAFAWVGRSSWRDDWVYPFLNVTDTVAPLWYMGLIVGHGIFFGVALGLAKLKRCVRQPATPSEPLLSSYLSSDALTKA
ncbi:hypothetical protein SPRG_12648 [Saprolegnia parasitica CBS 223.65]|uniref:Uncharacterized protein n=1 Tax=Saprolegnia parasitica (strain CBS 223.65) TaxID=695850 RepID=A0A067BTJ3_SAPPC|nr:hypothetical protein SPRG_12648 [Saprolegnia parasitica CBS 223.65]KDO21834.1 hypothetical protein SPRG_12648 [Saprolegnia parasitica CBS 223.65]|eukprot:XP_012207507.1 hypothetical protein SPRG_12648 [Saprolegnia parasitica CBS 223.65]